MAPDDIHPLASSLSYCNKLEGQLPGNGGTIASVEQPITPAIVSRRFLGIATRPAQ